MSQASAHEQYLLELVNAERARAGVQPLAFDGDLNESSEGHSRWMIEADVFSHTGAGGSSPTARMQQAGYSLSGSWTTAENISWASTRAPAGHDDEVRLLHQNLMNSPGHRANILNGAFREIGIGFELGVFQGWDAAFVTQNFAKTGTALFVTGVAFGDKDGDGFYDPGEGLGGLSVTATGATGARYATTTGAAGGYDLALNAGTYTVTFSGAGLATTTRQVTVGTQNVKIDLVNPAAATVEAPAPAPAPAPVSPPTSAPGAIVGDAGANTLQGTAGGELIQGLGGADRLHGLAGDDRLEGGAGKDVLNGGAGADILVGGAGDDRFVFDAPLGSVDQILDFSHADDTIQLENAVFTALTRTGTLASSAFHIGSAAQDASDRIIYDQATGALWYDPDGTGAAAPVQFAQLQPGLGLTNSDFLVS